MCVKGNQKKLYEGLQAIAKTYPPIDFAYSEQQAHGRSEHRLVATYDQVDTWRMLWPNLARLIYVHRWGLRDHQPFAHRQYYITDLCADALTLAALVRGHWSVENQLHWPKDVVLNEDRARQRTGDTPANWSFIRNIFINLARNHGFSSITKAKRFFANRPKDVLLSLT
ncbi:MAG: ISAs1 family transposase [Cyanobacteria bacterium J06626_6]